MRDNSADDLIADGSWSGGVEPAYNEELGSNGRPRWRVADTRGSAPHIASSLWILI